MSADFHPVKKGGMVNKSHHAGVDHAGRMEGEEEVKVELVSHILAAEIA
jgi:hypothetical protein